MQNDVYPGSVRKTCIHDRAGLIYHPVAVSGNLLNDIFQLVDGGELLVPLIQPAPFLIENLFRTIHHDLCDLLIF